MSPERPGTRARPMRPNLMNSEERASDIPPCSCGLIIIPVLNFLAFFLNFVFVDIKRVSAKFDTALTPPDFAFLIWIPIYITEFLFVVYQLFYAKPRGSRLIQTVISLPFIFHQILTAVWLIMFSREKVYEATGIITGIWILALLTFALTTREFRTGRYKHYGKGDYFCIELPLGLLFGWETLALLISWSVFLVKLEMDGKLSLGVSAAAQIAAVMVSLSLIVLAAVLFAGLPILMDPVVHVPLIWGFATLGYRWFTSPNTYAPHLSWATPELRLGIAFASWIIAGITGIFFLVAAAILISSRLCMPEMDSLSGSSSRHSLSSSSSSLSSPEEHRSPRTARSALSAERAV